LGGSRAGVLRPAPGRGRRWALGLLAALTLLALAPSQAGADAATEAACRESFARVQRALEARSAEGVVNCMLPEGTLTLTLLGVSTRPEPMKREQALKVLKSYFELVSAPKLVARPGQPADALVRAFDYTRRLRAGDPSTTRLTLTLKKDAAGLLRLHSIVETAR
jgi:hypothetical protein